jgi:chorismate mutase
MSGREDVFYVIREDILPEAILKTAEAKRLLETNEVHTVNEAVEKVGLSRSAFYKYKDGIFPFNSFSREKMITVTMDLEHRSGVLSHVLKFVADKGGNILTINQTIPLQGIANVALSIDATNLVVSEHEFLEELKKKDGVKRALIVGRG